MRTANLSGRLTLVIGNTAVDVEKASDGEFSADPQAVYDQWESFCRWVNEAELPPGDPFDQDQLGSPATVPRQVLAIGLNYSEHAAESGFAVPTSEPPCSPSSAPASSDHAGRSPFRPVDTDWKVELVAVIGSVTMGVPNVLETTDYYAEFGLRPEADGWFCARDDGGGKGMVRADDRARTLDCTLGSGGAGPS
ncbi:MAG: hypothetical protein ACR2M5_10490 [Nakamurella sp.]